MISVFLIIVYQGEIKQRRQQNGQEAAWVGLGFEHAPVLSTAGGVRAEVPLGKPWQGSGRLRQN